MKWLLLAAAALPLLAHAQTPPVMRSGVVGHTAGQPWDQGYVPTPTEWINAFAAKQDALKLFSTYDCGSGATDSASGLNVAAAALAAQGGGTLRFTGQCLISGADFLVPDNVQAEGSRYVGLQRQFLGYDTVAPALIVDPARTVRLGSNSRLRQTAIKRRGLTTPTDMRSAMTALAAFAGTGVTIGGNPTLYVTDASLEDVSILGFDRCIDIAYVNRARIKAVGGDCNNGVRVNHSHDNTRITEAHFWETLTTNQAFTFPSWPIASASNNGGVVRVVLSAPMPAQTTLVTGDWINAIVPGSMTPNRVTASVVNSTTIDLIGTTYAGAYTGGGRLAVNLNRRPGNDVEVYNSENTQITNSLGFGYVQGTHVGTRAGWTNFVGKSYDFDLAMYDPNTVGYRIDNLGADCPAADTGNCGAYGTSIVGGVLTSAASEIIVNSPQSQEGHSITGVAIQGAGGYTIQALAGSATFTGNTSGGMGSIYVGDGVAAVRFVGNDWPGGTIGAQSSYALGKITQIGNRLADNQDLVQLISNSGQPALAISSQGGVGVVNINVGGCPVLSGTGSPQSVVAAPVCAQWYRKDGGTGTTLYVKETGTGNTGWVAK